MGQKWGVIGNMLGNTLRTKKIQKYPTHPQTSPKAQKINKILGL
jgi:hypothetical protein